MNELEKLTKRFIDKHCREYDNTLGYESFVADLHYLLALAALQEGEDS